MSTPVLTDARQTVAVPTRVPRRFGLFSVVTPIDGGDSHWMLGGLTADGEECSTPLAGTIDCAPSPPKSARSWFSDIEGDPWLTYMYETCKPVGRWSEAAARLRTRFLAAEQSAAELGLQTNLLAKANFLGNEPTVSRAIAVIEAEAANEYGGEITIIMGPNAGEEAIRQHIVERFGNRLETISGNPVVIGNLHVNAGDGVGTQAAPAIYGTGGMALYRSPLAEAGPFLHIDNNDYYALVERAYAALVDCFLVKATGALCDCGGGAAVP